MLDEVSATRTKMMYLIQKTGELNMVSNRVIRDRATEKVAGEYQRLENITREVLTYR